jgi:hypothetical protein
LLELFSKFTSFLFGGIFVNYPALPVYDYRAFAHSGSVVFQPVTPRAYEAFKKLPEYDNGLYFAHDDEAANALFERLDALGLRDFTLGKAIEAGGFPFLLWNARKC